MLKFNLISGIERCKLKAWVNYEWELGTYGFSIL